MGCGLIGVCRSERHVVLCGLIARPIITNPAALIPLSLLQAATAVQWAALKKRIKEICETRVRYGYRRVHFVLQREGWPVNAKKTYRIYKEMGLQLRNKTPKRRVKAKLRDDRTEAVKNNDVSFSRM